MSLNFDKREIQNILKNSEFNSKLPVFGDIQAWKKIGQKSFTKEIIKKAKSILKEAIPDVRFSSYKEFNRFGDRKVYENPANKKMKNLRYLVIAEGIEREGKFIDCINDYLWSICEETAWVMSAHLGYYDVEVPFKGYDNIDLGVVGRAQSLAEIFNIMNDYLATEVKERLFQELEQRVFTPFLRYNDFWWMYDRNNWNSVCHSGIVKSAILMDLPRERLARILKKMMTNIPNYMDSFDDDGCTSEGVGYWNYGFGNFVEMADIIYRRTEGKINLFKLDEKIDNIVEFPLNVELSPGKFPTFADCPEKVGFSPYLIYTLVEYFDKPELYSLLKTEDYESTDLKSLLTKKIKDDSFSRKKNKFFHGFQWLISRVNENNPEDLVLAIKGGHNAEDHNHNDCGSFIIHAGRESLVSDLGRPPYTKKTFSAQRYSILACRSKGHNVPVVNGYEQKQGEEYRAQVIEKSFSKKEDKIIYELKNAYPEKAGLEFLKRKVLLNRENSGHIKLVDNFKFTGKQKGNIVEHIYSYNKIISKNDNYIIKGNKVNLKIETIDDVDLELELIENAAGKKDAYLLKIKKNNINNDSVMVKFIPQFKKEKIK